MKGTGGVSKEYLERRVLALEEENEVLGSEIEELRAAIERRDRAVERLEKLLKYYYKPQHAAVGQLPGVEGGEETTAQGAAR